MKRKGETLTEFLTASAVFVVIMAGVFEFIANQTENLASINDRDQLMFNAERFMILSRDTSAKVTVDKKERVSFDFDKSKNTLTVNNGRTSMTFKLKP